MHRSHSFQHTFCTRSFLHTASTVILDIFGLSWFGVFVFCLGSVKQEPQLEKVRWLWSRRWDITRNSLVETAVLFMFYGLCVLGFSSFFCPWHCCWRWFPRLLLNCLLFQSVKKCVMALMEKVSVSDNKTLSGKLCCWLSSTMMNEQCVAIEGF